MQTETDSIAQLEMLSQSFRERYLTHEEVTSQLKAWCAAWPDLTRLRSLTKTPEGRDVWLLSIGREQDRGVRPAIWVDANIHATELAGSSVALAIAEDVLRAHLAPESGTLDGLSEAVRDRIRDVSFYIMPRMSPDGAEAVLGSGRFVRSSPRDRRPASTKPRWIAGDVDGDGRALLMRVLDPTGEFVESKVAPGLMVRRTPEDDFDGRPSYKLYSEGFIEHFDGHHIPDPHYLADNDVDLNRNFPFQWAPDGEQAGAGPFPASEPESRAVVEFASQHREIFAWLSLHTFGGIFLRPPGDVRDAGMNQSDLAIYRQLEKWGDDLVGYPMGSVFNEFLYQPERPLRGELTQYAYSQRGALAYVCELWDLFKQVGIEVRRPFINNFLRHTRADLERIAEWDRMENQGRVFQPWKRCTHSQLGEVEVGGYDPIVGVTNPPFEKLASICAAQSAMLLRVASLAPIIVVERVRVLASSQQSDTATVRLELTFANVGYLGSYGLPSAKTLPWNEPPIAEVLSTELLEQGESPRRELGHLEGWGRGLGDDSGALFYFRSQGSTRRTVTWTLRNRGSGSLIVRVGSSRMGVREHIVPLD